MPDDATAPVTGPRGGGRPELTNRRAKEVATDQPSHPDNWKWRNDKSLSKLDVSHRKAGWWAVDTNNPNSWQAGGSGYMAESTADVILTQEVKIAEGYPQDAAEQAARTAKTPGSGPFCGNQEAVFNPIAPQLRIIFIATSWDLGATL